MLQAKFAMHQIPILRNDFKMSEILEQVQENAASSVPSVITTKKDILRHIGNRLRRSLTKRKVSIR